MITILKVLPRIRGVEKQAVVECSCGKVYTTNLYNARKIKSCGCTRAELRKGKGLKHGYYKHYLYSTWKEMVGRCHNPNNTDYANYGGRGIVVCAAWKYADIFIPDVISSIGDRPEGHTLDRVEKNGDYTHGNIIWATLTQQNRNRNNCVFLTIDGVTKHINEWAEEYNIKPDTIRRRLHRQGLSGRNLVAPLQRKRK